MIDMKEWEFKSGDLVNINTGEVIAFGDSVIEVVDNDIGDGMFARLYLDSLPEFELHELPPAAIKLLWHFIKQLKYIKSDKYIFNFGAESKVKLMNILSMKERTFRDAYYKLRDRDYIIFLSHNKIQLNPKLVARGNAIDITAIKQSIVKATEGKYYKITEFATSKKEYSQFPPKYKIFSRFINTASYIS